jgi:hypothetical protein
MRGVYARTPYSNNESHRSHGWKETRQVKFVSFVQFVVQKHFHRHS